MLGAWQLALVLATALVLSGNSALAAGAAEIDRDVTAALQTLYANTSGAKDLDDKAKGILVFPNIVKGGFLVAAQYGDGALRKTGNTVGYYRSLAASYGFQAGIESFGYILFFMDDASLQYLNNSEGWELGTGPTLVVLDRLRQEFFNHDLTARCLRFYLRPEGIDGRSRCTGLKNNQDQPGLIKSVE